MKQHFGELRLTIDELKEMLQNKSYSEMISKMQYYVKQIIGTNSYWYQTKEQLKAALNQLASPTILGHCLVLNFTGQSSMRYLEK